MNALQLRRTIPQAIPEPRNAHHLPVALMTLPHSMIAPSVSHGKAALHFKNLLLLSIYKDVC